ncbi:SDR family NAD(P)-dependent oxidoreductase [Arcticibacterium luteifluviistationis]|uniref:Oxidoreductase n=1 Tax=Arcticibacterium luteifluviistationis TaxID=1784714 RepID=A0A2Z4GBF5_9BACT|nr:glucose 1-dehydrogenase [Arcticibacterium luteifluviistationis]AWV98395.1 oxidoreductase [Arcticibacterium luteifluviistationis]
MTNLKGKVAIVTGGGRDIGKMTSIKLASMGAKVVVNYFGGKDAAEQTLKEIKALGGEAILFQGDMTKPAQVENLLKSTIAAFGSEINILVNNAGGLIARKTLAEMDEDFINSVFRLNFNTTFLVTKAVVPHMPKGSSIINLASQAGRDGGGGGSAAYSSSKGAVMTFSRAMAKELGPQGIRVNSLCPGMIATTFHDTFTKDEIRTKVAAGTPLRREGRPEEVADLIAYLATDQSSFITGNNIDINGGLAFS